MPTTKVQAPDGRVLTVEHPEGATSEQIIAFARRQAAPQTVGETPVAPPGAQVERMPGPLAAMGRTARERAGDIAATVAATAVPGGAGVRPFAARLLASEGAHDLANLLTGNKVTPGYGGASQLVGEGAAKVAGPLVSGIPYRQWAKTAASTLADKLKDLVPAWAHLPSTEKGLYEMVHGTGQRVLSAAYDKALQAVKGQIPSGRPLMLSTEDAAALGLKGTAASEADAWAAYLAKRSGAQPPRGLVQVDLREAVDALPGARKGDLGLYRRTLRGVDRELEHVQQGLGAEFMQERAAYRSGAGFMDFAERGRFLHGERFDPAKAQAALDTTGKKALLTRGMDDVRSTIRGPEKDPIEVSKRPWWVNRLEGAAGGEGLAYLLGVPRGVGGIVGGAAGGLLPTTTYRNVPMTPAMQWASRLTRPAIAEGTREAGRELDVPSLWP